jgi:hypothetical protein
MKIAVEMQYAAVVTEIVELPDGKTWGDVDLYFVKWGTLHLLFKDDSPRLEVDCSSHFGDPGLVDTSRPDRTAILAVTGKGMPDYDSVLAEHGC